MFDLSFFKLAVLALIAVIVFGPDQLPRVAGQAGRALRELRRLADGARNDLREGLGPEFADFDLNDLNPRHFVRKHLLDDIDAMDPFKESGVLTQEVLDSVSPATQFSNLVGLAPGETPPYDGEAT